MLIILHFLPTTCQSLSPICNTSFTSIFSLDSSFSYLDCSKLISPVLVPCSFCLMLSAFSCFIILLLVLSLTLGVCSFHYFFVHIHVTQALIINQVFEFWLFLFENKKEIKKKFKHFSKPTQIISALINPPSQGVCITSGYNYKKQ
jgi:hypothetical protein